MSFISLPDSAACAHKAANDLQNIAIEHLIVDWLDRQLSLGKSPLFSSNESRQGCQNYFLGFLLESEDEYVLRKAALEAETTHLQTSMRHFVDVRKFEHKHNWLYIHAGDEDALISLCPPAIIGSCAERVAEMQATTEFVVKRKGPKP